MFSYGRFGYLFVLFLINVSLGIPVDGQGAEKNIVSPNNVSISDRASTENQADVNECARYGICGKNAHCTNFEGSYKCTCDNGFTGDGLNCTDIDECSDNATCDPLHADCENSVGSYTCTCRPGYQGDGVCTAKPPRPQIDVLPSYDVFGVGENVNLMCKTDMSLFKSASYHFLRNGFELTRSDRSDKFYVYNIPNATVSDSGLYFCLIKYDTVSSEPSSNSVSLRIKEFTDLSCDFEKDMCNWFNEDPSNKLFFEPSLISDVDSLTTSHGNYFLSSGFQGAFLRSPVMTNYFHACLKFQYRMDSEYAISLSVWIYELSLTSDEQATGQNVWEAVGYQATYWMKATIKVEPQKNFYIVFQCQGRVDIDDFRYTIHGRC